MKTIDAVKKQIKNRMIFAFASSMLISVMCMLSFYAIFLMFPGLIIKTGLIAPGPLYFIWFMSLSVPVCVIVYRYPIYGKKFFSSIIRERFTAGDVRTAIELDRRRGYPADMIAAEGSLSSFLSGEFSRKVSESLDTGRKKILGFVFPGKREIAAAAAIIAVAAALTVFRIGFLSDIVAALRTGLPTELISTGPVIKFEKIEARVVPPAYLESGKIKTVNLIKNDYIRALEGSKVIINGRLAGITKGKLFFSTEKGLEYFPIAIKDSADFEVSFLAPTKGAFALEFDRMQNSKNKTGKSRVYRVETFPDLPPEIKIFSPEKNFKIVYGNSFGISFIASDDYGLSEINLCHREAGSDNPFNTELITRFPRESKKQYNTTYVWNPIIKEGEKYQELVYPPGTEKVEYYIEVRDINIFSNKGITKSGMMYVSFTNLLSGYKNAADIIKELIKGGKELLGDINNTNKKENYRGRLDSAIKSFTGELSEILPRSSLIFESQNMQNTLSGNSGESLRQPLESYVSFLQKYLTLLDFLMKLENFEMADSALNKASEDFQNGKYDDSFKRLASIAEMLGDDIMNELDEIRKLAESGETAKANEKMDQLLKKIREKLNAELEKRRGMAMQMAQEAMQKLDQIIADAKERIKEQNANIITTKNRQVKDGIKNQGDINKKLENLTGLTQKLSSEYPIVLNSINSYASTARTFGKQSSDNLERNMVPQAVQTEENVVRYLDALIKDSEQQKKQIQQMAKGNFESLMPQDRMNWFVFIPKEAVYTVPVQYKDKIIEMSKKRSANTEEKESFWKDVLE